MTKWTEERCTVCPQELQSIAEGIYMERRNIEEITHETDEATGTEEWTEWVCESREISVSEYEMLKSIEQIDTTQAIDDYTMQLIEEGVL